MNIKNNITLIFGIAIPVLMIIFVACSIYLPRLFIAPPKYNFLYLSGNNNCYIPGGNSAIYSVQDGKLVKNVIDKQYKCDTLSPIKIYSYDVLVNQSKEISLDEAQKLNLDSSNVSPDGFQVVNGDYRGGESLFFYSGSDYNSHYIEGHSISKKLNISQGNGYYEFYFLGWIK